MADDKRHVQRLPSGEIRVYRPDAAGLWVLAWRMTAGGTVYDGALIGGSMDEVESAFRATRPALPGDA